MENNYQDLTLVTGATSGIGFSIAKELKRKNYNLLLIDKNEENLIQSANKLDSKYYTLDLSDQKQVYNFLDYLKSIKANITCLVNNAGIGLRGEFIQQNDSEQIKMVNVNCVAPLILSNFVLGKFIENGRGTLINIVSTSAFQPLPYLAVYSASKVFLYFLSIAVAREISNVSKNKNVEIITVNPSGTRTSFQKSSGVKENKNEKLLDPDYVAAKIISKIGKGSSSITIGRTGMFMNLISRVLPPGLNSLLWASLMKKMR